MTPLELHDVSVHYGLIQAVSGLSFIVATGEVVALIGANGAGKSTTMRAISGIRPLSTGAHYLRRRGRHLASPSTSASCAASPKSLKDAAPPA